ncbi:MAG: hypothetical protein ACJASL_000338 [Paraglaciecola sp.]
MADTNQVIIVDLFEAAMTPLGYEIEHLYLPYARRFKAYETGGVDVVSDMNLNTINQYGLKGFFSDIAYSYEIFNALRISICHFCNVSKSSKIMWRHVIYFGVIVEKTILSSTTDV